MEHSALDNEINHLRYLFMDAKSGGARWKDVWTLVASIRRSFRDVRYPSRGERDDALNRFESVVSEIEAQREQAVGDRARLTYTSQSVRIDIEALINSALSFDPTSSDVIASIIGLGIPGVNMGLMVEGPIITRQKEILRARSKYLQDAWDKFKAHKHEMTTADRSFVHGRLTHVKSVLDEQWSDLKNTQQREREDRRSDRRSRIEANVEKNSERRTKLYARMESKTEYLDRLQSQCDSARTDEFRIAMEDKIERVSGEMANIQRQIDEVEGYIEEDERRLREME